MSNFQTLIECMRVMKSFEPRMTSQSLIEAKISQRSVDKYLSYIPDSYEASDEEKLSIAKELAYRAVNGVVLPKPYNSKYANAIGFGYYNRFNDLTDEEKVDVISRFKPSTLSKWKDKMNESDVDITEESGSQPLVDIIKKSGHRNEFKDSGGGWYKVSARGVFGPPSHRSGNYSAISDIINLIKKSGISVDRDKSRYNSKGTKGVDVYTDGTGAEIWIEYQESPTGETPNKYTLWYTEGRPTET